VHDSTKLMGAWGNNDTKIETKTKFVEYYYNLKNKKKICFKM